MPTEQPATRRDRTHYLYIAVIVVVFLGVAAGLLFPGFAKELKPLGTGFVNLIKMMTQVTASQNTTEFLLAIIATTLVSAFTSGHIRQILLVAMLGGFALQKLGPKGEPIRRGVEHPFDETTLLDEHMEKAS